MRILVIGDLHCPYDHSEYFHFVRGEVKTYKPELVVFIGDIVDEHSVSYKYPKEPDMPGPSDEFKLAYNAVQKWYHAFPKALVCIGNHDERPLKTARMLHIPPERLKIYGELWNTPNWKWAKSHEVDGTLFIHYLKAGNLFPSYKAAQHLGISCVMGHVHCCAGVQYLVRHSHRIDLAVDTGCGIDPDAGVFRYADETLRKPVISVACLNTKTKEAKIITI